MRELAARVGIGVLLLALVLGAGTAGAAVCGDGTRENPEQCDDANVVGGDGCSADCFVECPSLDGDWRFENDATGVPTETWHFVEDVAGQLTVTTSGSDTLTGERTPGVQSLVVLTSETYYATLSGEMLTCDQIVMRIPLLPYIYTLTRLIPPPFCPDAVTLRDVKVTLSNLTAPAGKHNIVASGRMVIPAVGAFLPEQRGVQIVLEDLAAGSAHAFDVTYLTHPVPPYATDTCAARGEGWRHNAYRSVFKPLDAPECRLGDADALTLRLSDLRPRRNEVSFALRARGTTIPAPAGPVRLTLALGTTEEALAAARCGLPQPVLGCYPSAQGKTLRCK